METVRFEQMPELMAVLINKVKELTEQVNHLAKTSGELSDKIVPGAGNNPHRALNVDQAAAYLGRAKATVYKYAERGILPCTKRNGSIYFFEDELLKWLEKGRKKSIYEIYGA